ncbi:transcriptional regulator [Herbaspirillum sp. CF444]|uniref:LysR substrate-binding domain-containing protein n=1 Tax=Herbaspirillum sp. CF444 TaxID=1144319 RepID=UPI0002723F94|nr:LysR substrate-binding domain-containing protein [Herbaspirillum sp. CF444]EJL94304.1 transcriptional regulator [Herbaspirillum sp. CF444]
MSNIRYFRTFLAVAQGGSYASASERMALTQAAVGLQMRTLETELKTILFEKSGRGVQLSIAGRALIPHAKNVIAAYDKLREDIDADHEIAGTITIGSIVSAMGLLSNTVVNIKQRFPRLNVRLLVQNSDTLVKSVENGDLDAAIFVEDDLHDRPGLTWTPLYTEPLVMIVNSQIPAPDCDIRALLRDQPFLRFDRRTPSGIRIERTLLKLKSTPQDFLELGTLSSIVDLVRQNVGIAIVPQLKNADWENDPSLRIVPLPGRPVIRQIGMLEQHKQENITSMIRQDMTLHLTKKRSARK